MNSISTILSRLGMISGVLLLAVSPFATGQPDTQEPEPSVVVASAATKPSNTKIIYRPPCVGAPVGRVGGGTRGYNAGSVAVSVIAPEEVSLTTREH